ARARDAAALEQSYGGRSCVVAGHNRREIAARRSAKTIPAGFELLVARVLGGSSEERLCVEHRFIAPAACRAIGIGANVRPECPLTQPEQGLVALTERKVGEVLGRQLGTRRREQQERAIDRMAAAPLFPERHHVLGSQFAHAPGIREGRGRRLPAPGRHGSVGSTGSVTSVSRSQPSFSSLMCWIATAFAFASRSGSAWYSDTQQRKTL